MRDVVVGARLGGIQEPRIAAIFVANAETVKRPSLSARPTGVTAKTLLRALPQKLARLEIEYTFLSRRAITTNQAAPRGQAVPLRDVSQVPVARLTRGI